MERKNNAFVVILILILILGGLIYFQRQENPELSYSISHIQDVYCNQQKISTIERFNNSIVIEQSMYRPTSCFSISASIIRDGSEIILSIVSERGKGVVACSEGEVCISISAKYGPLPNGNYNVSVRNNFQGVLNSTSIVIG